MSKLIILRGNSGSGKSSLAKTLQRKFGRNTMIIPQDTVRREILWVHDGEGNPSIPLMMELLKYGKSHSDVVILEGILDAECYVPLFRCAIEEFGLENIFAYYYDIPFEETLVRHETKAARFEFGEADMRRWWKEKDYIAFSPETVFTKDVSLEKAVETVYLAVTAAQHSPEI